MGFELPAAYALDLVLGDPPSWPHPVRGLGRLITLWEGPLRRRITSPRLAGVALATGCVLLAAGCAALLIRLAGAISPWLGWLMSVVLLYGAIAVRDLADHAWAVYRPLQGGDLPGARRALANIVGRETAALDEAGIIRATVETIAENMVDGIISPLFYAALGGAPLAWAFKAVSTLDSMVGYKTPRYQEFGWAGAKLDDLANWLPARLSGFFFVLGAALTGVDSRRAWQIFRRDGRRHASPNAGWPEAAMSGALGLRLGGPNVYQGVLVEKPWIGDALREPELADIPRAIRLLQAVSILAVVSFTLLSLILKNGLT
ncbi:MAG: adenosylcobinamide-phosphate synthase CbiB [Desulfobacca sp.]|uniref:adenosylcobinamide-phosphate synthase CbiB n=1 Tax=Desulfobacca sp. TaxID=2067990 RepID=UPI0040490EFA